MNERFITKEAFQSLVASHPIYIFDTNVYLNLLRYSKEASIKVLDLYKNCGDIFIPSQVVKEFDKNFAKVTGDRVSSAKKSKRDAKEAINNFNNAFLKSTKFLERNKFNNINDLIDSVIMSTDEIRNKIESYDVLNSFIDENLIKSFFEANKSVDSTGLTFAKKLEISQEGMLRYQLKLPPGYCDDPKFNSKSNKSGIDIFGDLFLWKEILTYEKSLHRPVIFVTADLKEDWFVLKNKEAIAPRPELYEEFFEVTNNSEFCVLTSELFIEYMSEFVGVDNTMMLIEMKRHLVVGKIIKSNTHRLENAFLNWINQEDNIQLLRFDREINHINSIEITTLVEDEITVEIDSYVDYEVVCKGILCAEGGFTEAVTGKEIYTTEIDKVIYTAIIGIKVTKDIAVLKGDNIQNLEQHIKIDVLSMEIENKVDNVIEFDTSRGIFTEATNEDLKVYDYMESIWDGYESKHGIDKAEALVYIDASKKLNRDLLSINRSYTLVQNSRTGSKLSLNEIDSLAIRRFRMIGFEIEGNICIYDGQKIVLGERLDEPETHKSLKPITGKEIDLYFDISIEYTENKHIIVSGKTNLPEETNLILTLSCEKKSYRAQSKSSVSVDGCFKSEPFSNKNDKVENGKYELTVTVPLVSVQPDSVQPLLGEKSRNLIGDYIVYDEIFGNQVRYSQFIEIILPIDN